MITLPPRPSLPAWVTAVLVLFLSGQPVTGQENHCAKYNGLFHHIACCAQTCGTCGGLTCENEPGGGSACCAYRILESSGVCGTTALQAPCTLTEFPDLFVDLKTQPDGTKVLSLSANPNRQSDFTICDGGDIEIVHYGITSILFARGPSSEPFKWVGLQLASAPSDLLCLSTGFTDPPFINGSEYGFTLLSIGDLTTGPVALMDRDNTDPERTLCYRFVVGDANGNPVYSDPKIYNKRPTQSPTTTPPICTISSSRPPAPENPHTPLPRRAAASVFEGSYKNTNPVFDDFLLMLEPENGTILSGSLSNLTKGYTVNLQGAFQPWDQDHHRYLLSMYGKSMIPSLDPPGWIPFVFTAVVGYAVAPSDTERLTSLTLVQAYARDLTQGGQPIAGAWGYPITFKRQTGSK